tara:strand:- start:405 stop:830 length:426 start_codon:yes stop_codon:yes gene_type:complete
VKITRRQLRRLINEAINEHRIKPTLPGHIPAAHVEKIHSLIDGGSHAQAQSLIDGLGGDPNYARNYIAYGEVGDLEKLGNEAAAILSAPGPRHDAVDDIIRVDDRARVIARKSMENFEDQNDRLDAFYHSYYDRYARNRTK